MKLTFLKMIYILMFLSRHFINLTTPKVALGPRVYSIYTSHTLKCLKSCLSNMWTNETYYYIINTHTMIFIDLIFFTVLTIFLE